MRMRRHGNPIALFVRARLHRRIFIWFGMTILFTGIVVYAVMSGLGAEAAWKRDMARIESFMGDRFARVWDDPVERDYLGTDVERDLDLDLRLTDEGGRTLSEFGEKCPHPAWKIRVAREGRTLGYANVCIERHHPKPWRLLVALGLVGVMLWGASGVIARRLSRPVGELARVADAIGGGDFAARVHPRQGQHYGEITALALAINGMAEKIERQFRDQRELLAAVSHEIRTPLARIRLLLELAREKGIDDESLTEVDREVVEMDALVSELLASSRLDFSALTRADLDSVEVAKRALERESVDASLLVVRAVIPRISADPTLVARALANLLQNAKRHGEGLTALRVELKDDFVCFSAEDNGPGIDPADSARIFDPFYKGKSAKPAGHDDKPSLGLGLALVRRIAEAHGGTAWAEAGEKGGARIGFSLPRAKPAE